MGLFLLSAFGVKGQALNFSVSDNPNITGYEVGSKRAPVAYRQISNNNTASVDLIEIVFASSVQFGNKTVGAAVNQSDSAMGGKMIATDSWVDANNLLHVSLNKSFGVYSAGLTLPANTSNFGIVIFGDIPANTAGGLVLSLVSYQAKFTRPRAMPTSFPAAENGYIYQLMPQGTVGFQSINPVSVTLTFGGPSVPLFTLTSTTANQFSLFGYPTWYGPGINQSSSSGGISPGGATNITVRAEGSTPIPPGVYFGTQLIKDGNSNIAKTVPVDVTVQ